jgi:hypothetical protein
MLSRAGRSHGRRRFSRVRANATSRGDKISLCQIDSIHFRLRTNLNPHYIRYVWRCANCIPSVSFRYEPNIRSALSQTSAAVRPSICFTRCLCSACVSLCAQSRSGSGFASLLYLLRLNTFSLHESSTRIWRGPMLHVAHSLMHARCATCLLLLLAR